MSGFSERLAEALIKSLSQQDLNQLYVYIKYLQICFTTVQNTSLMIIGNVIGITVGQRIASLKIWSKQQIIVANLGVLLFLGVPIFLMLEAVVELNSASNLMNQSLSNYVMLPDDVWKIQFVIGLVQVLSYSAFSTSQRESNRK